ncbi:hypothetical protein HFU84_03945 [Acidithiobacillus sp. CV18-2]|uniref:Uncharacterized protein n=1 Tax=Igneacidithiobacillus copahuensis TaxID=2724909 RepID=A0AAE2YMZ8_9PROT|nr:hypothetical protein [Acidithiobacillus sp. CV18-3]MBU2756117.1 hypothetical protein [Acidithiobacillus sp. BN09-2]MBU2776667.1 hypothetical protein [Acidithiobacillus sp. CV18-2]MBU2786823.1 hypothetical protein [Igneacidithiobacillus copahuensis]MBU2797137.1 hypothetical protein [Acidithiobacillus sp. VAN18-2]MBU2799243.1 hypothetical protein [Acidithiobacillus sp. VAN18-4]MDD3761537.1 hypothetical protein [Acidithiobacillus sp.]UTV81514.1 hypothetical protein MQE22_02530 [Acidithiobaci
MDNQALNARCVELFQNANVKLRMWNARMFWQVGDLFNVPTDKLTQPKVDLCELEVMLSTAALTDSQCAAELDKKEPGRAAFIQRQVREGMRPLLRPASH